MVEHSPDTKSEIYLSEQLQVFSNKNSYNADVTANKRSLAANWNE